MNTAIAENPVERPAPDSRSRTLLGRAKTIARLVGSDDGSQDRTLVDGLIPVTVGLSAFVSVDTKELVGEACRLVRALADSRDVDIVVHCACEALWIERRAFMSAVHELLDNAVRATRRHYPVIVDVRDTSEKDVLWQIQDAGEGMSEKTLRDLGRSPPGGCGLGVALAWGIIEKHGGLLRFESAIGVGTTASVWLPGRH